MGKREGDGEGEREILIDQEEEEGSSWEFCSRTELNANTVGILAGR